MPFGNFRSLLPIISGILAMICVSVAIADEIIFIEPSISTADPNIIVLNCTFKADPDRTISENRQYSFIIHDENTGDEFTYCSSGQSNDAMECFQKAVLPSSVVFSGYERDDVRKNKFQLPLSDKIEVSKSGEALMTRIIKNWTDNEEKYEIVGYNLTFGQCEIGPAY